MDDRRHALHATIDGRPQGDRPRVLIASESVVLRAGIFTLLRDQHLVLVDAVGHLDQLPSRAAAKHAQAAVVAPVGSLATKLLILNNIPLRIALLLPPAALRIHSKTLQPLRNVRCLPLQASRDSIVQALIEPELAAVGAIPTTPSRGPGGRLTPRQQEVLDYLVRGLRNCEIAAQLAIREDTVKAHLGAIYRKLRVKSRAEAITAYLEAS
jgi:DNA-binding CsgD family transcriptional regulator